MEKKKVEENIESKKKSYKKIWIVFCIMAAIFFALALGAVVWYNHMLKCAGETRVDKPVIYLYPEEEIALTVKLKNSQKLTCSYPLYDGGWEVIAKPDGTLIDLNTNRELYCLYYEANETTNLDMQEGFVVKGEEAASFLEEKLDILGLTNKEAEEFIIYWLPKLENNEYNYIKFATVEEINEYMPLEFSENPDTIIRVLMQFKALDEAIDVVEQKLEATKREGFVVVEWGGTEIK